MQNRAWLVLVRMVLIIHRAGLLKVVMAMEGSFCKVNELAEGMVLVCRIRLLTAL